MQRYSQDSLNRLTQGLDHIKKSKTDAEVLNKLELFTHLLEVEVQHLKNKT